MEALVMKLVKKALGIVAIGMAALALTACGKGSANNDSSKPVHLTWYIDGTPQKDLKKVNKAVNKYIEPKYNVTVTLNQIDWGEYDQKMGTLANSGQKYDLAFSCSWLQSYNYLNNARKGSFLDITKYVDDSSKLKGAINKNFWKGATIDGKLYGVPAQKEISATEFFVWNKALVDKYNIPYKKIQTYAQLEPWLKEVKEKEGITPWFVNESYSNPTEFDQLAVTDGFDLEGNKNKVIDRYDTKKFQSKVKTMRDFVKKGYVNKDASLVTANDVVGRKWLVSSTQMSPLDTATIKDTWKTDVVVSPMTDSVVTNSSATGGTTVIGANTDHPKEAFKLLKAVNTDPKLMNMLAYGIEGVHYKKTGKDTIKWMSAHERYTVPFYMFGNYFNLYHQDGASADEWKILKKYNEDAKASPALGFSFDTSKVTSQIAAMQNVDSEFKKTLNTGSVDPETALANRDKKMKAAGSEKVINELQSQYNKWKKSNK